MKYDCPALSWLSHASEAAWCRIWSGTIYQYLDTGCHDYNYSHFFISQILGSIRIKRDIQLYSLQSSRINGVAKTFLVTGCSTVANMHSYYICSVSKYQRTLLKQGVTKSSFNRVDMMR